MLQPWQAAQAKAAFFRYGTSPEFPSPDDGIAAFFAQRLTESSGIEVNPQQLLKAFNALGRQPGPFREMVEAMDNAANSNVQTYLDRQIGQIQSLTVGRLSALFDSFPAVQRSTAYAGRVDQ